MSTEAATKRTISYAFSFASVRSLREKLQFNLNVPTRAQAAEPAAPPPTPSEPMPPEVSMCHVSLQLPLWRRIGPIKQPVLYWLGTTVFTAVFCVGAYHVLLKADPQIGDVYLSAATSNYVVAVLSQIFSQLTDMTTMSLLDAFRWSLASRTNGASFATFFQMTGATDLLTVIFFTLYGRFLNWWGVLRLAMPFLSVFFGSILKFQADFKYHFIPTDNSIPVFAGLMPIDTRVLSVLHTDDMCAYFNGWTTSMLRNTRYSQAVEIEGCDAKINCTSVFLPGGLELARKALPSLNHSIFEGGLFDAAQSILIENAPGMLVRFDPLDEGFEFDRENECKYYGVEDDDIIQLCSRNINESLAVGWKVCPDSLWKSNNCLNDTSWHTLDMPTKTNMSAYRQFATTSYEKQTGKIIDLLLINETERVVQPLNTSTFQPIWTKIFTPPTGNSTIQLRYARQVRGLLFNVAFLLRLYEEVFPDDKDTPLMYLQNFLGIPVQFSSVTIQFANSSDEGTRGGLKFPMPEDMLSTATAGRSGTKLVSKPWTVWAFIGGATAALGTIGLVLLWMVVRGGSLSVPSASGIAEIDMVKSASDGSRPHEKNAQDNGAHVGEESLSELVEEEFFQQKSMRKKVAGLRRRRIKVHPATGDTGERLAVIKR